MNFPESSFFDLLYTLINTPGIGSIVAVLLAAGILIAVALTLRWIVRGAEVDEGEEYAYPTPALHHRDQ
jgi:hypothetical protein